MWIQSVRVVGHYQVIIPTIICCSFLISGCSTTVVQGVNSRPTVSILSPTDMQILYPGRITFTGVTDDPDEDDRTRIDISWLVTSNSGEKDCLSTPDKDGSFSCQLDLAEGAYTVTVTARDTRGGSAEDSASFTLYNAPPTAELILNDDIFPVGSTIQLEGIATDLEDQSPELIAYWSSNIDGALGTSQPDSDGEVTFETSRLSVGEHVIKLSVVDTIGATDDDSTRVVVIDCPDTDLDGFDTCGSSGKASDCYDSDASSYPGAAEYCDGRDNNCDTFIDEGFDQDDDGVVSCPVGSNPADCNDAVSSTYPGAEEQCNNIDDDCDGLIDEGLDADSDGVTLCDGDCDDSNATVYEGATEVCDLYDNDCDGRYDEGYDLDGDGAKTCTGDCNDLNASIGPSSLELCNRIDDNCDGSVDEGFDLDADGITSCAGDCNDNNAQIYPNASEACNGIDDDCDATVDEGYDLDGDGYKSCDGDCDDSRSFVNPAAAESCDYVDNNCDGSIDEGFDLDADNYSTCKGDCNDGASDVNPGAIEFCNGIDDNCNGQVDEPYDSDLDGVTSCAGDCNDEDPTIYASANETCDGKDNDCDDLVDEGSDQDGDGVTLCAGDCNDLNADIYSGAKEVCDLVDNDCDNQTDEGVKITYYIDIDGDGYGSPSNSIQACSVPTGYVTNSKDCDDTNPSVYPGAAEGTSDRDGNGVLDGDSLDNDCDGVVDEGTDAYDDDDDGYSEDQGDCDDRNSDIFPTATEGTDANGDGLPEGDGIDNDCDGQVDNGTTDFDDDGDGYAEVDDDCDDADSLSYPSAFERYDHKDNNCDSRIDWDISLGTTLTITGPAAGHAGYAVAGTTDLNNDGHRDLVIGAPAYSAGRGAAYVVYGDGNWAEPLSLLTDGTAIYEPTSSAQLGYAVAAAGDLNDDGIDDLAIGAPTMDLAGLSDAGAAYILFGQNQSSPSGAIADVADASILGIYDQVFLGISIAGGGDVNGDGYDDLLIGGPWPSGTGSGAGWIMILPGGTSDWSMAMSLNTLSKVTGNSNEGIGYASAILGRTTSDAYADIITGGQFNADIDGVAWFIPGSNRFVKATSFGPTDVGGTRYNGETNGEFIGSHVAPAGDVNGDGYQDFLVGRRENGASGDAKAYVFLGPGVPASGAIETAAPVAFFGSASDGCPCNISGIGDIDDDGYGDIAISATANADETAGGRIYVVLGGATRFSGDIDLADADLSFISETSGDSAGFAISPAGDLDSDAVDDFVIGAPYYSFEGSEVGRVYAVLSTP